MKKTIKIYLEEEEHKSLLEKAEELDFTGRASLSHFLSYISTKDIAILDTNLKKVLRALDLS